MWGKTELKQGQIGKVTILTDGNAVKLKGSTLVQDKRLKRGEEYRIYTYRVIGNSGYYGLGGGLFVKKSNQIKYETPSKRKLQALGVKTTHHSYAPGFEYPKVEGLIDSNAEKKINDTVLAHIKDSYKGAQENEYAYDYNVGYLIKYNHNNLLSILIYDEVYLGGTHGMTGVTSYNFDTLTGTQITLGSVAKSSRAFSTMERYARVDLLNQEAKGKTRLHKDQLGSLTIDNSTPFFFYDHGIVVKFQEHEVGPYAGGRPESGKIADSVFK